MDIFINCLLACRLPSGLVHVFTQVPRGMKVNVKYWTSPKESEARHCILRTPYIVPNVTSSDLASIASYKASSTPGVQGLIEKCVKNPKKHERQ